MSLCMRLDTLQAVIRAFNVASDDPTRFHINSVLLEPSKERREVRVTATNGHALASVVCPDEELCEAMGGVPFKVEPDAIPVLKLLAKDYKTAQSIPIKWDGAGRKRVLTLGSFGVTLAIKAEDGDNYPDYSQVIPRPDDSWVKLGINAALLMDLAKAIDDGSRNKGNLNITLRMKPDPKGVVGPIQVMFGQNMGVIMPVRL